LKKIVAVLRVFFIRMVLTKGLWYDTAFEILLAVIKEATVPECS